MRFLEVFASVLAEKLMSEGTQIFVNPDEIKWPNGTVSKPVDSKGKRKKKKPNSKDGVYGRLVNEMGGRKKAVASTSKEPVKDDVVIVVNPGEEERPVAGAGGDQPRKKNKGIDIGILIVNALFYCLFVWVYMSFILKKQRGKMQNSAIYFCCTRIWY